MTRFALLGALILGTAALGSGLPQPAHAQSVGMPAGRAPATAPGGTKGLAGRRNVRQAIRSGEAYGYRRRLRRR